MTVEVVDTLSETGWSQTVFDPAQRGTWGYAAGISGTRALTGSKRVLAVTAAATAAGASMTINGGDSIPIPANFGFAFEPRGNLTDPTFVFTGTDSYFVEYVT